MAGGRAADIREIARRCRPEWPHGSFLAELKPSVLQDFLDAGELVSFRKGEVLVSEGDLGADVFLLLEDCVKATARLDEGKQALLAVRVGGDIVGEIAVLDGGVRTATVSTCGHGPVSAVRVGGDDLRRLLGSHPDAAVSLASAVSRKFRALTRLRIDITGRPAKVRMARALLEMAEDYGHPGIRGIIIGVNLTRIEIGSLVDAGPSTAERALRELRESGLILKVGRRVLVPDMDLLRSAASLR
jgi:CRP/FNR family cyclic AMP-dependent transcriptional regulator